MLIASTAIVVPVFASGAPAAMEAEYTDSIRGTQYFKRSVSAINNITPELKNLAHSVDSLYRIQRIDSLLLCGNASPDGPSKLNTDLAFDRAKNVASYLQFATSMPSEKFTVTSKARNWNDLLALLESRDWDEQKRADEAIRILKAGDSDMVAQLRAAQHGWVWKWLDDKVFPLMRATSVVAFYETEPINLTPSIDTFEDPKFVEPEDEEVVVEVAVEEVEDEVEPADDDWRRHIYVKTNLPAWLFLWMNAACEIDIAPHFSATLPIYYSGFNYFTRTLKFRTFAIQPELRYWPNRDNSGFFVGGHFGMAYYNIALKGDTRWQDHDGDTPALGGGLAIGWRFRLNSNPDISMEATVGYGIYKLDYDTFENRTNGWLTGRHKRTFYGVDQAALSFVYRFGLGKKSNQKKGGER